MWKSQLCACQDTDITRNIALSETTVTYHPLLWLTWQCESLNILVLMLLPRSLESLMTAAYSLFACERWT